MRFFTLFALLPCLALSFTVAPSLPISSIPPRSPSSSIRRRNLGCALRATKAPEHVSLNTVHGNEGSSDAVQTTNSKLSSWRLRLRTYLETPSELTCQTPLRNLQTLVRITVPSLIAAFAAYVSFPWLALQLAASLNNAGVFAVLSQDSSQFVQNFLTVTGLLFSILVGQTYYFMYQQQEAVYLAVFNEVTEVSRKFEG